MMSTIDDVRLERISAKDDLAFRLGDTLDVKASIGLVVITFLAAQTAYFLDKTLPSWAHHLQFGSVVLLAFAGIIALLELWPRDYMAPGPESDYIPKRIEELMEHYGGYADVEENVADQLKRDEIEWAKNRVAVNQGKNRSKILLLMWAFWFTGAAVIVNLITLFALIHHSS